jgi:adenylate cyclase
MRSKRRQRKLAAVLAADVEGFTRLMGLDEDGTIETLAHHRRVTDELIHDHRGRIERIQGDSIISEFGSAIDAVTCAVRIQTALAEANTDIAPHLRMYFRIGINVGDIVVDNGELHGDAVHVAVRLQSIADAGSTLISRLVYDLVRNNIDVSFEDLGEKDLKNIAYPVRAYRVIQPQNHGGSLAKVNRVSPPLVHGFGNRPGLAVLPFANVVGDEAHEYIADGLTEEVIAALACWREFPVIARNSSFRYKGKAVDAHQIGVELGVRYVVEGSVRRDREGVRVLTQLVDATNGYLISAATFDNNLGDVAAIQDEIAARIVGEIAPELQKAERQRAIVAAPKSLDAYDCMQRGMWHHHRYTRRDNAEAHEYFMNAIALDPGYAQAVAALAHNKIHAAYSGWTDDAEPAFAEAFVLGQRAVALDPRNPGAHSALGMASLWTGRTEIGIHAMQDAIALNPSFAAAYANLGFLLNYCARAEEAAEYVHRAMRLSPYDNRMFLWLPALAGAYYQMRNYEEAISIGRRAYSLKPDHPAGLRYVIASLGQLGRRPEAHQELLALLNMERGAFDNVAVIKKLFRSDAAAAHLLEGFRKAGMNI